MGYDVEYEFTLHADDEEVKQVLYYGRGRCGWEGDAPPPGHPGEGLNEQRGEWCIAIADGKVTMKCYAVEFYHHYMTRMHKLLKKRVPSLRGYVSCGLDIYWTVTDRVLCCERQVSIHEYARHQYELVSKAHKKRSRGGA